MLINSKYKESLIAKPYLLNEIGRHEEVLSLVEI